MTHGGVTEVDGFLVTALEAGVIELVVKTASGEIIDRIDEAVEIPQQISFVGGEKSVRVGEQISFSAAAIGAGGQRLEAYTGWSFDGDAPALAKVIDGCGLACFGAADFFHVEGLAPGTVNVSAEGGGTTGTLAVTVTP